MLASLMQAGYATVEPWWGCYELVDALAPMLMPVAAGFGFGVVYVVWRLSLVLFPLDHLDDDPGGEG